MTRIPMVSTRIDRKQGSNRPFKKLILEPYHIDDEMIIFAKLVRMDYHNMVRCCTLTGISNIDNLCKLLVKF